MTVQAGEGRVDILIVTAVKDEWDAVLAVDSGAKPGGSWETRLRAAGPEVFYRDFAVEGGGLCIGVVQAFGMGREQAVMAAAPLLERHPEIRCLAMCGVCAGRRGDVALGDVIIADRAWPYDAGKLKTIIDEQGHRTERFQGDMDLYRIHPPEWKQRAERFQIDPTASWIRERPRSYEEQGDWVLERLAKNEDPRTQADRTMKCPDWAAVLEQLWKAKRLEEGELQLTDTGRKHIARRLILEPDGLHEPGPFKTVVGPIASGAPVVQDPMIFERLSDTQAMRKVVGLEMETSAILGLAYAGKVQYAVVMKGVMDHADVFKSDNMKPFAARASAECLIAFLRNNLPPDQVNNPKNDDTLASGARQNRAFESHQTAPLPSPSSKCTVLFLAANPSRTDRIALDREARAIQAQLERCHHRDQLEIEIRWIAEPLDLLRELRMLKPMVVHFSGHDSQSGLFFQAADGRAQIVSTTAFAETFGAAGTSVKLVVLNACYIEVQAKALLAHVDYVVGMSGSIQGDIARSFAISFYEVLGTGQSIAMAYERACITIKLERRNDVQPQMRVREGVHANRPILVGVPVHEVPIDSTAERRLGERDGVLSILGSHQEARLPTQPRLAIGAWPLNATVRRRYVRYVGREDVLDRLDEWLLGPDEGAWVVVTGGPGMGKSTILSAWLTRHEIANPMIPHHFIRRQLADWDQPEVIAVSLATQIEAVFPEIYDPNAKPERRLLELLGRVSMQLGSSGRLVLVIDGLDETRAEPDDNPLPRFLPPVVPAGIRILCSTRRTYPHLNWIEARNPVRNLDLDESRWALSNQAVVRGFWESVAHEYQPPLSSETMAAAIVSADGNVLHAEMLHHSWCDLPAFERRAESIPSGLERLLEDIWDRIASHGSVCTGLGLLCAAREALSLDVLTELAGWSGDEKRRFVRDARQLLAEEPTTWAGAKAYRPRHGWVRDLIVEWLGVAIIRAHHETLAQRLAVWPPPVDPVWRQYAVRHALAHRIAIGDGNEVRALALNLEYLEARTHETDVYSLEQELTEAKAKCPDQAATHDLADLTWALARESHWVRSAPMAVAGLIWNRLRRSGWDAADLDATLKIPDETSFLRVRYATSRESASLERTLDGHMGGVTACAVTPDGRRVVSASIDRTLKIWDLDAGLILTTLDGHTDVVTGCAIMADGRHAISASADRTLKIWDLDTGCVLSTLEGHATGVNACAVTPDGRRVISASADGSIKVWDLGVSPIVTTLDGHARGVTACAITPDGRRVISASADLTLKVWDLDTGHTVVTLEGHTAWVNACAVTLDGHRVVSASADRTLKVWDLDTGHVLNTLEGHMDGVTACAVTPDSQLMVSASHDGTLKIWNLDAGRVVTTLEGHADVVSACALTRGGRRVVSASFDHTLKIWDPDTRRAFSTLDGHTGAVSACAAMPDGRRVISASRDGTLKLWDLDAGKVLSTLHGHDDYWVNACAVAPDGRRVISASDDGTLKVWDLEGGGVLASLEGSAGEVHACAVTPNGRRLVSAFHDRVLQIWDLDTGLALDTLEGHADAVTACAVTPDGRRVISASDDRTLKVWDLDNGRILTTLHGHANRINACVVTPDGRRVISASDDCTLKIWELTGRTLATLDGHASVVRACTVTPDGRYAVSASDDSTLKVWDLENAKCILTHRGDAAFYCVAATADIVIAGDRGSTVWFLDWPRGSSLHRSRT